MRDRLIEVQCLAYDTFEGGKTSFEYTADIILADGWIRLPCKVGDEIYVVSRYYGGYWQIHYGKVNDITIYKNNTFVRIIGSNNEVFAINAGEIGNGAYLTLEEAENALKARERE